MVTQRAHGAGGAIVPGQPVSFATAHQATGQLLQRGEARSALVVADALHHAAPAALAPLLLLGRAWLAAGEAERAIGYLRRAILAHPLDAIAWGVLAAALSRAGRPGAMAALHAAVLHDPLNRVAEPGDADAAQPAGRGIALLRRGRADLACAELTAAVRAQPARHELRLYLVEALRRAGDLVRAEAELAQLPHSQRETFPALLLGAAFDHPTSASPMRAHCVAADPDGELTRQFFAPEGPPWLLPAAPLLPWNDSFALLRHTASRPPATPVASHSSANPTPTTLVPTPAVTEPTEQLRERLADAAASPVIAGTSGQASVQLVLSARGPLMDRFGAAGFAAIDDRLQRLTAALTRRGIATMLVYGDDPLSLAATFGDGSAPVAHDAVTIRALIQRSAELLTQRGRVLHTVLLIGGDEIVPLHRLANPVSDDDPLVFSDTPYACDDPGALVPQRIVARVPTGDGADPAFVIGQLDRMITYHQHGGRPRHAWIERAFPVTFGRGRGRIERLPATGYSTEIWRDASRAVIDMYAPDAPLAQCPPVEAERLGEQTLAGRLVYFNLHGASGMPNLYGQPADWGGASTRLPVALRPDQLGDSFAECIFVSEACYGAELTGRTANNSVALRALHRGALAFVGSTVNAYGSTGTPLVGADLLCERMLSHLQRGVPIGEALYRARIEFAQEMVRRQGHLDDVDIKTLTEFVLYGDPWATLANPLTLALGKSLERPLHLESIPRLEKRAVIAESDVPQDVLQRVRDTVLRLMPGAGAHPLTITSHANPRRMRKGDGDWQLVFFARDQRLTTDGRTIPQLAHLTWLGARVIKIAASR